MPVTISYPGVYIEEVPSGVRTITGVATSITAFIGRSEKGPLNKATMVNSAGDYERTFGAAKMFSPMYFAVQDYYRNGGSQAVIVRLFKIDGGLTTSANSRVKINLGAAAVLLDAASPGTWGAGLRATMSWDVSASAATSLGVAANDLFNLTVKLVDPASGAVQAQEVFRNLTVINSARRIDKILAAESKLVTYFGGAGSVSVPQSTTPAAFTALAGLAPPSEKNDDVTASVAGAQAAMGGNDGKALTYNSPTGPTDDGDFKPTSASVNKKGLWALEQADLFNILVIPPYLANSSDPDLVSGNVDAGLMGEAGAYCETRRAMLLVDPPSAWVDKTTAKGASTALGTTSKNAALYFPRLQEPNPLRSNRMEDFVPSGAVAGIWARTDATRGVWKAPAGLDATLVGVPDLRVPLTDLENGELNPLGVNCLRTMPAAGRIVWGARTMQGDDRLSSEWKYIPVRRTALFIEESLFRGTQWVVFEPNDEPLWAQIRLNVGAFMHGLFRQGAFQGKTPKEAYFVKCDKETTTQDDIDKGIVNVVVGFAPLKPAEFVVIKIQQLAGQVAA